MLGTELIGWFAEGLGKRPDGVQVQPDRGRRIMPDLEVLQHPLSKWCHSKNSFRCDHITNRLPAEPSTPWNVRDSALHLPEGLCSMVIIGLLNVTSVWREHQIKILLSGAKASNASYELKRCCSKLSADLRGWLHFSQHRHRIERLILLSA